MDPYAIAQMTKTAGTFQRLAALSGVNADIAVENARYVANGQDCGPSVHGLYEWLEKQPGYKR